MYEFIGPDLVSTSKSSNNLHGHWSKLGDICDQDVRKPILKVLSSLSRIQ